jgi:hypothetical protein
MLWDSCEARVLFVTLRGAKQCRLFAIFVLEFEPRRPEILPPDIPESRRSLDVDDRDRLPIGLTEASRDRLVQSAELNRERLPTADEIRDRYVMADRNRELVSADRERAIQMELTKSGPVESSRNVDYDRPASTSSGHTRDMSIAKILSTSINFDNPTVKQALDNLMSGGPSIFKSVSDTVGQKGPGIGAKYPEGDSRY